MDIEVRNREAGSVFDTIEGAIEDIRQGRMVLVADDENRENEGDLIVAAAHATADNVNFMARYARGLICAPVSGEIARRLRLDPLTTHSTDRKSTAFLVTVDAREGTTTGISAEERALTARLLSDLEARPEDFLRPGHLFPLEAREGGVLVRAGHTEATVDLVRLAGLPASGLCCGVLNDDGTMARLPDLIVFAKRHGLKFVAVKDLIAWRCAREKLVEKRVEVNLPTDFGLFCVHAYRSKLQDDDAHTHVALVKGDISGPDPVLVRVHSECFTGDIFGSLRCDCGEQLHMAMRMIEKEGRGVVVYLNQEGRGIGLMDKIHAYKLQDEGMDTVEANLHLCHKADERDYGVGALILSRIGVTKMRLITNNPVKRVGLEAYGLEVVENVPIEVAPNEYNAFYMRTKKERMGHTLTNVE